MSASASANSSPSASASASPISPATATAHAAGPAQVQVHLTDQELYERNAAYNAEIAADIAKNNPRISPIHSVAVLEEEMKNSAKFLKKVRELKKTYSHYRAVRRDGSCFYRALFFKVFENAIANKEEGRRILGLVQQSLIGLVKLGYDRGGLEDFYEVMFDTLNEIVTRSDYSVKDLEAKFNDEYISEYIVTYARYLTSYQLQQNSDLYSAFVEDHPSLKAFIQSEVEPVNKDAEHLTCVALTTLLGIGVRAEYVDQQDTPLNGHILPDETAKPTIFLLYRPGHYDILYKKDSAASASSPTLGPASSSSSSSSSSSVLAGSK